MKHIFCSFLLLAGLTMQGFSQGYYLEYKLSGDKANGTMKTYSQDGNSRSEISMFLGDPASSAKMNRVIVTLTLKDNPDKAYMLDVDKKTYSEMDLSKRPDAKDAIDDYEVTVLGKEKVNGYNATHVKIKNKKTSQEQEFWNSTEIPHYADFQKIKSKYTGKENLTKAIAAKGADGFPVRIAVREAMGNVQLDLLEAKTQNNPADLFSLSAYTKTTGAGIDRQQMMQQLQNMTPEERQKFIEQMRQQQSAPK